MFYDRFGLVLMTPVGNAPNWFSAPDHSDLTGLNRNGRNVFIQTSDWEWITSAPLSTIVTYELIQNLLFIGVLEKKDELAQNLDWIDPGNSLSMQVPHASPRGCINDMCQHKGDFHFKLRTGDICDECLEIFELAGATPELLRQVSESLNRCRETAVNTSRFTADRTKYRDLPYPIAVTRHKATNFRDEFRHLKLLVDHFDSLVRYAAIVGATVSEDNLDIGERPSLGDWVSALLKFSDAEEALGRAHAIAQNEEITNLRNENIGHGYAERHDRRYRKLTNRLEGIIEKLHTQLRRVFNKELIVVEGFELKNESYRWFGRSLKGSSPIFDPFEQSTDTPPTDLGLTDTPSLGILEIHPKVRFRSVEPWIKEEICPTCSHQRVLVADGKPEGKTKFIDVQRGHRTQIEV